MRSVIVTGGATGIGEAVVERFATSGWRVLSLDVAAAPPAPTSAVTHERADVTRPEVVGPLVEAFCLGHGLDALVNNAAIQVIGPTLEQTASTWHRVLDVNVIAPATMARLCHRWLAKNKGAIVNVSSVHAISTSADIGLYAASKGALVSLTRSLAIELAPEGIRVNAVLPGAVDTDMLRAGLARSGSSVSDERRALAGRTVLGRVGRASELAHAIEFLADDDRSSFVTGASLVVDGGATSRLSTE